MHFDFSEMQIGQRDAGMDMASRRVEGHDAPPPHLDDGTGAVIWGMGCGVLAMMVLVAWALTGSLLRGAGLGICGMSVAMFFCGTYTSNNRVGAALVIASLALAAIGATMTIYG